MSNHARRRRRSRVVEHALAALVGQRVPGGCQTCDAYQTVAQEVGHFHITVHHDDDCPRWQRIQRQEGQR